MKSLQSVLCAAALALTLSTTVLAGNIHFVSVNGNITTLQPGDISGKPGESSGLLTWGDITGVITAIFGNIHF